MAELRISKWFLRREAEGNTKAGPFGGVPTLIKDLVSKEGEAVSYGCVFFRDFVAEVTGEFRRRIDAAGFIDLGRTNTPELGLLPTADPLKVEASGQRLDGVFTPSSPSE